MTTILPTSKSSTRQNKPLGEVEPSHAGRIQMLNGWVSDTEAQSKVESMNDRSVRLLAEACRFLLSLAAEVEAEEQYQSMIVVPPTNPASGTF